MLTRLQVKLPEKEEQKNKLINYVMSVFSFVYFQLIIGIEIKEDKNDKNLISV